MNCRFSRFNLLRSEFPAASLGSSSYFAVMLLYFVRTLDDWQLSSPASTIYTRRQEKIEVSTVIVSCSRIWGTVWGVITPSTGTKFRVSLAVFASDLYCFSCFGYDEDDNTKCHSRDSGELFVRKCTSNSSEAQPACIKFKASYHIPQLIGETLKRVRTEIHAVHCGTRQGCERKECPNFWRNDFVMEDCKISCCERKDGEDCSFPVPNKEEIASFNERKDLRGGNDGNVKVGARGSGMARIFLSTWLQAVCFAIFGWLKLWNTWNRVEHLSSWTWCQGLGIWMFWTRGNLGYH